VDQVIALRLAWISRWQNVLIDATKVVVETFLAKNQRNAGTRLCLGERVLATFVVAFDSQAGTATVEAVETRREADAEIRESLHPVLYEERGDGSVDWSCEELNLEGTSPTVSLMKLRLTRKYGFRFSFGRVAA
jgi:hypothetical protein